MKISFVHRFSIKESIDGESGKFVHELQLKLNGSLSPIQLLNALASNNRIHASSFDVRVWITRSLKNGDVIRGKRAINEREWKSRVGVPSGGSRRLAKKNKIIKEERPANYFHRKYSTLARWSTLQILSCPRSRDFRKTRATRGKMCNVCALDLPFRRLYSPFCVSNSPFRSSANQIHFVSDWKAK